MKVLLLGSTGNVGARLLSALLEHGYEPVLYVRNASKLPQNVLTSLPSSSVFIGDASDSKAIQNCILESESEAVVSAAGIAGFISKTEQFPAIFRAIVEATEAAAKQRGKAIRCWMLGGFGMLSIPGTQSRLATYLPIFPDHKGNFSLLESTSTQTVAWSMLCAYNMAPSKAADPSVEAKSRSSRIVATADVPPEWSSSLSWIPLIGTFLNICVNINSYNTTLEEAAEAIVRDLNKGLSSEFVGKRVGIKIVN